MDTTIATRFAKAIETKFNEVTAEKNKTAKYLSSYVFEMSVEAGQKYIRIRQDNGYQGGVHAFIDSEGRLIKAASYKKPQKNSDGTDAVRFDLSTAQGFKAALEAADWAGSYLYKR